MAISVVCPHCGQSGKVPDNSRGRRVRCWSCKQVYAQSDDMDVDVESVVVDSLPPFVAPVPIQAPKPPPFSPPAKQRVVVMPAKSGFSFPSFLFGGCLGVLCTVLTLVIIAMVAITTLGTSANITFGNVGKAVGGGS
jgi:hypothetical protein